MSDWAKRHGWRFTRRPVQTWWLRMPGLYPYGVTVAISGTLAGRSVTIAEYEVRRNRVDGRGGAPNMTLYRLVLVVVGVRRAWPAVAVTRRGPISRAARAVLGGQVTGNEAFDRGYGITIEEPSRMPWPLTPALLAEHVAGLLPQWSVDGTELLAYREGRITDLDRIRIEFAGLLRVADLIDPR